MQSAPAPFQSEARTRLGRRLLGLAFVATVAASACCVLPLALVLIGVTGAWMTTLTSLQPVTPLFGVIALGALVWAGVLIFRPSADSAEAVGQTCSPDAMRLTRRIYIACALFAAAVLGFPLVAPLFY